MNHASAATVPFDLQPVLRGDLVEIRPLRAEDFDALYAVSSDPLIWEQHPAHDRWQRPVFEQFFADAIASGGAFAIVDRANGRIIGSSRFINHVPERREIEIGFTFLARAYWGGRYNGEVKRLMLQHAFQFVGAVVFIVGKNNIRSQRAMERIGGLRDGVRPDSRGDESYVFRIDAPPAADRVR